MTWDAFFAAEVGAAAALAGLIFVGLSINVARILKLPTIATRALQSLLLLLAVLAVESLLLVPGVPGRDEGLCVLGVVLPLGTGLNWLERGSWRQVELPWRTTLLIHTVFEIELPCVLLALGGVLLVASDSSALYWFVPATLVGFGVAIVEAWVILIEINR